VERLACNGYRSGTLISPGYHTLEPRRGHLAGLSSGLAVHASQVALVHNVLHLAASVLQSGLSIILSCHDSHPNFYFLDHDSCQS
jgi:hypothetical protein